MSRVRTFLVGTLLTGLALGQAGCGAGEPTTVASTVPPPSAAVPTETATSSAPASTGGVDGETTKPEETGNGSGGDSDSPILSGKRKIVIKPAGQSEGILAVNDKGRLVVTDGPGTHTLFVLVPVRDGLHQIRTAKAGNGGEPSCMGVKNNGSNPLTVAAAACDAGRAGQLFRVRTAQEASDDGYGISNQGAYLQISRTHGLIAEELSDAPLRTVYTFVDNGAAPAGPGE
jgi:hypothetical protein